jgi:peptide/nickel transport system substrate-binding protein
VHGGTPRCRLIRIPSSRVAAVPTLRVLIASIMVVVAGCGTPSGRPPQPSPSSPSPSPSSGPKPGGTLRIAGVARSVDLDPASLASEETSGLALPVVDTAAGNRLVGRLVLRQLYGYTDSEATQDGGADGTASVSNPDRTARPAAAAAGPQPDLAAGAPKLTDGGRSATITLRTARWDVPSGRRVTATDELRALKRLCLPSVSSPVRGYLTESVVGYAAACTSLGRRPPRTLADLDDVTIPGLTTQGDTTLVVQLLRPTNDLTAILSLPETSPLPVESFTGLRVTNDPQRFVGDGPYRFVQTQGGETYALSRSPSWDPADDLLHRAYVDHISIRGGLSAAQVQQRLRTGGADLSLDVPASPAFAAGAAPDALIRTPAQALALLAVGAHGPAAVRLAVPGVRRVIASCVDTATRTRVAAALGPGVAVSAVDLLGGLSLTPDGQRVPSPTPSATASPSTSGSASAGVSPSTRASGPAAEAPTASPSLSPVRCARTAGVTGATIRLLTLSSPQTRAAAAVIASRLAAIGVRVTVTAADAQLCALLARRGAFDLLLAVRPLRYPAPRAVLAPLLDEVWPGADAVALRSAPALASQMLTATAERDTTASVEAWDTLRTALEQSAALVSLAQLSGVYARGPNVVYAPTAPTFSNADPANVALGSTLAGDPSRGPTPTP